MVQFLKFWNAWVISLHTLLGICLLTHTGIIFKPCKYKKPLVVITGVTKPEPYHLLYSLKSPQLCWRASTRKDINGNQVCILTMVRAG